MFSFKWFQRYCSSEKHAAHGLEATCSNHIRPVLKPSFTLCLKHKWKSFIKSFVSCLITQSFWAEVIKWCSNRGVVINHLSAKDILFGIKVHKDNLFINHILLVGKQYIYNCRCTKTNPCLRVFLARLNNVYQLETIIAKSKNKMSFH